MNQHKKHKSRQRARKSYRGAQQTSLVALLVLLLGNPLLACKNRSQESKQKTFASIENGTTISLFFMPVNDRKLKICTYLASQSAAADGSVATLGSAQWSEYSEKPLLFDDLYYHYSENAPEAQQTFDTLFSNAKTTVETIAERRFVRENLKDVGQIALLLLGALACQKGTKSLENRGKEGTFGHKIGKLCTRAGFHGALLASVYKFLFSGTEIPVPGNTPELSKKDAEEITSQLIDQLYERLKNSTQISAANMNTLIAATRAAYTKGSIDFVSAGTPPQNDATTDPSPEACDHPLTMSSSQD